MKVDRKTKQRRRLARTLERAIVPERPFRRGPRYLVQPDVAAACRPSFQAIAAALRQDGLELDEDGLTAVLRFVTDGASPFYGRDETEALREAVRLQHMVIGVETAVTDEELLAGAA
jgi:hypothetical protein